MAKVEIKRTINAPVAKVWESWNDYGNIDKFNPNLNRSFLIEGSGETGLGAKRQCDLNDGKNYIQEKVIEYIPERRIAIDVYNGTMPLKRAIATADMKPLGANRTELTFTMEFTPKFGLIGRLMIPLMKPQFRKLLGKLMDGNKAFVEDGVVIARAA